jgi:hypothetical protein
LPDVIAEDDEDVRLPAVASAVEGFFASARPVLGKSRILACRRVSGMRISFSFIGVSLLFVVR